MGVGRVAVVVAAGVGDNPRGDAAERIANGLRLYEGFDEPVQHAEWYEVPDVAIQPVDRFETGHGGKKVDIYEFWWADLSRFPAASRSFLAAFFGLFLALPSFGRTALRPTDEIGYGFQELEKEKAGVAYHLLGFLGWLVAVPILVVSALLLTAVATLSVAVTIDESKITGVIGVGLVGVGTTALVTLLLWHYKKSSGRQWAIAIWLLALAGATALCVVRVRERGTAGRGIEIALADTVSALVAYPMRILWLAALAIATAMAVVLGMKLIWNVAHRRGKRTIQKTVTATLTVGFGPFGFATLMAVLSAAIGGIAQKVGPTVHWIGAAQGKTPWCLHAPDDWTLSHCPNLSAWDFGTLTLGNAIFALACAFVVLLTLLAVFLLFLLAMEIWHQARALGDAKEARQARTQAARISSALGAVGRLPGAVLLLLTTVAGAYAAAAAWLPSWWLPFGVKNHAWLTQKTVQVAGRTVVTTVTDARGPTIAAVLGASVSGLLLAARAAGITPQKLSTDSGASNLLRLILDKPYDIATFLRDPVGSTHKDGPHLVHLPKMPRQRILDRYEALLTFLAKKSPQYDRIVFATHSQGTVLTVTLLHKPPAALPAKLVSLVTFGCPLRQLYSERFPRQYAWVLHPSTRQEFMPRLNETWVNLGTAGDPVGRTVFGPVPSPWVAGATQPRTGRPAFEDVLLGKGGHSAYWIAPELYRQLARLIDEPGPDSAARV